MIFVILDVSLNKGP